jgi:DNA-directed RNA polymerase specialized sigma24 family protein
VYERYTPLLLAGLGRLAAKGYDVNPADALGVVHDFYVEALPGILERYDASRGSFATYIYGAFLHFARPRIVRELRWQRLLMPFDDAVEHAAGHGGEKTADGLLDELAAAYGELPKPLRAALERRLAKGESERATARRLEITRYELRQRVAEALGRLAIAVGRDEAIPEELRGLAVRLWRDEAPLMQVARERGWSRQEAHAKLHALVRSLGAAAARLGGRD